MKNKGLAPEETRCMVCKRREGKTPAATIFLRDVHMRLLCEKCENQLLRKTEQGFYLTRDGD